jgi:hypothetical protein
VLGIDTGSAWQVKKLDREVFPERTAIDCSWSASMLTIPSAAKAKVGGGGGGGGKGKGHHYGKGGKGRGKGGKGMGGRSDCPSCDSKGGFDAWDNPCHPTNMHFKARCQLSL